MVFKRIKRLAKATTKKYKNLVKVEEVKKTKTAKIPVPVKHEMPTRKISLSLTNVMKVVLIAILLIGLSLLIYEIRDILILFFISILFAAALDPTIDKLEQYRIPRGISAIGIFILIIGIISLFVGAIVPVMTQQLFEIAKNSQNFIENIAEGNINLPPFLDWLNPLLQDIFAGTNTDQVSTTIQNYLLKFGELLRSLAGNAFSLIKGVSNGLLNALFVIFFTYFMIVDEKVIDKFILRLFPDKYGEYIMARNKTIKNKVGLWLKGMVILMIIVGLLSYIGLKIIGIEYAFTLALFAGFTEAIPVIGPIIAWVITIPIAANSEQPMTALLWVTVLYFMIQRIENNILVPAVMKHATGLHPIFVLLGLLIGAKLMGILGAIISVPVTAILSIFLDDILAKRNK